MTDGLMTAGRLVQIPGQLCRMSLTPLLFFCCAVTIGTADAMTGADATGVTAGKVVRIRSRRLADAVRCACEAASVRPASGPNTTRAPGQSHIPLHRAVQTTTSPSSGAESSPG
jgi:hypothetical protein